jgi:type IV secretory pathway TrbD component
LTQETEEETIARRSQNVDMAAGCLSQVAIFAMDWIWILFGLVLLALWFLM